ncbi:hypothetical protein NM208_g2887 [Fusarium decemcellulare]|uniref:Uncharacterized protein n=1 Tax=Fusarium decemcellulare TaxID=57161 RepID=A0ACC1SQW7_9HYPO|nr:hypothetical protein NM208_g2887 [Fusarium decemcellulare]
MDPFDAQLIEQQDDTDVDQLVPNASCFDDLWGNFLINNDFELGTDPYSSNSVDPYGILSRYDAIPIQETDRNSNMLDASRASITPAENTTDFTPATTLDRQPPVLPMGDTVDDTNMTAQTEDGQPDVLPDVLDDTMAPCERVRSSRSSSSGTLTATIGQLTPQDAVLEYDAPPAILSKVWTLPSRPARGRKPKTSSSGVRPNRTNRTKPKARSRRRGPLGAETRKSAALKRQQRLVCVICHLKKEACTFDSSDPDGPCRRCKLQVMPCVRYRITDTMLYREQKAPYYLFSQRWQSMDLVDITDWASSEIRTIEISLDILHAPSQIKVRKFIPLPGDLLDETWVKDGETIVYRLPTYAIANMNEAADSIAQMVEREASNYLWNTVGSLERDSLIWETYLAAFRRANTAPSLEEQILLFNTLRLWIHCRIGSHAEHIVGDDKLGAKPIDDPTSPYNRTIPIPPVLEAQLQCIYFTQFLRPLSKKVLRSLMTLLESKQRKYWYTIYLVLFMMLHSCSLTTRRNREFAITLDLPGYANPESIRQHNAGSRTLLAHFHLSLKGSYPFKLALQGDLPDHASLGLSGPEDINFITRSAKLAARSKSSWDQIRTAGTWENDFYWISQLYDDEWKPEKMD